MINKNIIYLLQFFIVIFCFFAGFSDTFFLSILRGYDLAADGIVIARTLFILFGCYILYKMLCFWYHHKSK